MKFFKDVYIENRLFDHRLVKNDLVDQWPTEKGNKYVERKDHRNLMESYVFIYFTHSIKYPCTVLVDYFMAHFYLKY